MAYTRNPTWQNSPSTATPITAATLETIENGLVTAAGVADAGATVLAWRDDFSRYPDGTVLNGSPLVGTGTWSESGAAPPVVTSGVLTSASVGYAYATLSARPDILSCDVSWLNPTSGYPMTMAWTTALPFDLSSVAPHFNFGPTGFNATIKRGSTFYPLFSSAWREPMVAGKTYTVTVSIIGNRVVVTANGDVYASTSDTRIATYAGVTVFWEPNTLGSSAGQALVRRVAAYANTFTTIPASTVGPGTLAGLAQSSSGVGVIGNPGTVSQVAIGADGGKQPSVQFGAATISTQLTSAVAIGATTFVATGIIPDGSSVIVDPIGGGIDETVTTSGFPTGSGPYTHTVTTAFARTHAIGTTCVATPTAAHQTEMYLHQGNGFFYLPNLPVLIAPAGQIYLGGSLDTYIFRSAAGAVASNGALTAVNTTTAGRPSASAVGLGAQIYDRTLSKPIWSDGTVWRDATGTAV